MQSERMEIFKLGATIGRLHHYDDPASPASEDCRDDMETHRSGMNERYDMREPIRMLPTKISGTQQKKVVYEGPKSQEISRTISADSEDTRTTVQGSDGGSICSSPGELEKLETIEEDDTAKSFPNFLTSMPKTWSGSSLSFIKFLLFVKETNASFIPEMDKMISDYDKLVNSLTTENKELKEKLKSEADALNKRVHDKKKLVNKLTKKLTDCQAYITELTEELERVYNKEGNSERLRIRPRPDEITIGTATSELTIENDIAGVEATLSRMLAEERSKAETLEAINKSLSDDLSASKKELEDLEKQLSTSEEKKAELEISLRNQWGKLEKLVFENKGLYEDLAGVVIELEETKEEFNERETQLIGMLEETDKPDTDELEATIAGLQEELAGAKNNLATYKENDGKAEAQQKLTRAIEWQHQKEINALKEELEHTKKQHGEANMKLVENSTMIDFAREIVEKKKNEAPVFDHRGDSCNADKDKRIKELERELACKTEAASKCLRDTLIFLYDAAGGSNDQDPMELLKTVRETSKLLQPN